MLPGCGRQLDLLKIVGKNFTYEIRHPVQAPPAKLKLFPRGNPGTHVGWIGHSTILMSFAGSSILTDPNFSRRIKIAHRVVGLPIEPKEIQEEALKMFVESGARYMIPIHWGTFILSHEPLTEPLERVKTEAKRLDIEDRVVILRHGESFTLPE